MKNPRTVLRAMVAAALVSGAGVLAATAHASPPAISFSQAEQIARKAVPNADVEKIELEHGVIYEVELRAANGVEHEVVIDANDGHVISSRIDDD